MAEGKSAQHELFRLSESDLAPGDPDQDLRGRRVFDLSGEIGTVEDLYLDKEERKARFLLIDSADFLGLGERYFMIPMDAVSEVEADRVKVNETRDKVQDAPVFNPEAGGPDPYIQRGLYDHYGLPTPFMYGL
jgi:sporulation protein YlmC with PRC-barrel domain